VAGRWVSGARTVRSGATGQRGRGAAERRRGRHGGEEGAARWGQAVSGGGEGRRAAERAGCAGRWGRSGRCAGAGRCGRTECGREWAWELAGPSGGVAKRAGRKSLGFAGWAAAALGPSWVGFGLHIGFGFLVLGWAGLSFGFGLWVPFLFLFTLSFLFLNYSIPNSNKV